METLTLADGQIVTIRTAQVADAEAIIAYVNRVSGESPFLTFGEGEFDVSVAHEREIMASLGTDRQWLLALREERIIGMANVSRQSPRPRMRHRAVMGVSVSRDYWSMGIGRALMRWVITWCRAQGFEQLELGVFAHNLRARHLYESLGFVATGSIPHAVKYPDGSYADEVMMSLRLG